MITCRDLVELLSDYIEGALPPPTARTLEAHLAGCAECAAFLRTFRTTRALTEAAACADMPADLRARLEAFLRKAIGTGGPALFA